MNLKVKKEELAVIAVVLAFFVIISLIATIGKGIETHETSKIRIADIDVSAVALGISEAFINVTTYLDNSGMKKSGEIEILVKAYDTDTNLLVASNETKIGRIDGMETKSACSYLKLPKEGGYRLQIVVFEDEKGIQRAETKIYGLERLEPPAVAKISIRELDFCVEAVEVESEKKNEYVIINTTIYIDNLGKDVSDLRALVKARENETRLIADKKWKDLGLLKKGTTTLHYANLRVINKRDYIIEVQIWQSDRIIKEGSGMVLLSPFANKTVVLETKEKKVEISPEAKISDFIRPYPSHPPEKGRGYETPVPVHRPAPVPKPPGFEVLSAVFAIFISFFFLLKKKEKERRK